MILIKLIEFGVLMLKDMLKTTLKFTKKGKQKLSLANSARKVQHKSGHDLGSNFYRHICSMCVFQDEEYTHSQGLPCLASKND